MFQDITITGIDHFGRGIAHINKKIVFVYNAMIGEVVDIKIIVEKKNYMEARVLEYKIKSEERKKVACPYYNECGGCNILHLTYKQTLEFKQNKIKELLNKNKIIYDKKIDIIENEHPFYYRNKASFKIVNGKIGFYKEKTHDLIEIKECMVVNPEINKVLDIFAYFGLTDASFIVRVNTNKEVLIIINSDEKNYNIDIDKIREKIKLVGIVYNDKVIYGNDFFYERIGGFLFKVSYDSFFQINPFICTKLFSLVEKEISNSSKVLDLYSGVGTLSLVASKKAHEVISVEIVKNAVLNGIFNAKLNKQDNVKFLLGNTSTIVSKLNNDFDTLIVDPPRNGMDNKTIEFIKKSLPKKIIYISCDPNTLMRDLKELESIYSIVDYKILDMFSYSYHVESLCVLNRL